MDADGETQRWMTAEGARRWLPNGLRVRRRADRRRRAGRGSDLPSCRWAQEDYMRLQDLAEKEGLSVTVEDLTGGTNGMSTAHPRSSRSERTSSRLGTPAARIKTLTHELAHWYDLGRRCGDLRPTRGGDRRRSRRVRGRSAVGLGHLELPAGYVAGGHVEIHRSWSSSPRGSTPQRGASWLAATEHHAWRSGSPRAHRRVGWSRGGGDGTRTVVDRSSIAVASFAVRRGWPRALPSARSKVGVVRAGRWTTPGA